MRSLRALAISTALPTLALGCGSGTIGAARGEGQASPDETGGTTTNVSASSGGDNSSAGGASGGASGAGDTGGAGGRHRASGGTSSASGGTSNIGGVSSASGGQPSIGGAGGGVAGSGGRQTGAGGSTLPSGPPPPTVSCQMGLTVGKWQDVTPSQVKAQSNNETFSVLVDKSTGTVYTSAGNKTNGGNGSTGLLRSSDCGGTFTMVNTGTGKDSLTSGDPWDMAINQKQPNVIYTVNGYGDNPTLWRSVDGGVNFTPMNIDPENAIATDFVQHVAMDVTDPTHLVLSIHENCGGGHTPACFSETRDGGDHWALINGPASLGGWQEGSGFTVIGANHYFYGSQSGGGWLSTDGGASWKQTLSGVMYGNAYVSTNGKLYIGIAASGIFVSDSTPLGDSWKQVPNAPQASSILDDGTTMYASYIAQYGGTPFFSAPLSNLGTWTNAQTTVSRGAATLAYDPIHHMVYAAAMGGGLWRLVTQ